MNSITKLFGMLFGGSKGVVEQVADVVDKFKPSPVTLHKMATESNAAEEQNVQDARAMQFPTGGASSFDIFVNALNRLQRPLFSTWAFVVLAASSFGFIQSTGFQNLDPFSQELISVIVKFFFGVRIISQDLPAMINKIRNG